MFCSVPYHYPSIGAHCCYNIRVLRLITGLVDLSFVIDLLHNFKFDLQSLRLFPRGTAMSANFLTILIVVCSIWSDRFRKLNMSNLKIVLRFVRGMCSDK